MTIFRHRITGPGPAGDIWSSSLHSSSTVTIAVAAGAWATFCSQVFAANVAALWPLETSATELITDQLDPTGQHNVAQVRQGVSYVGTDPGKQLPQQDAVVIGLRTALPTRHGRGRMFIPAVSGTFLKTDGTLTSAVQASLAGYWSSGLTQMKLNVLPVVFNRAANIGTEITGVSVSQVMGSQRRRTNKVPPSYSTSPVT